MATTRANDLANFIGAPSFTGDLTVDSDFSANTITSTTSLTGNTVTATTSVTGATITSTGNVNDSVSNVRTPRHTSLSADTTISNEGVYILEAGVSTLTLGAPAVGTVMAVYNNTTAVTLEDGTTITSMRLGADNNSTHNASLTLAQNSMTTITFIASNACVVTGTDVS